MEEGRCIIQNVALMAMRPADNEKFPSPIIHQTPHLQ